MTKVAVVVLNWNGLEHLKRFLPVLFANSNLPDVEFWMADNNSTDGSFEYAKERFADLKLLKLERNYGFSEGYNRALKAIDAQYYVLLNSDVEVTPGWLNPLIGFMDGNPEVAACMPKIKNINRRGFFEHAGAAGGFIDFLGYPFCRGRIFDRVEPDYGQYDSQLDVFWATGACMVVRATDWKKAGGFDSSFFAHMEEIDLCWRFKIAGKCIFSVPESEVFHIGGGTLPGTNPRKTFYNFRNSLLMLTKNLHSSRLWLLPLRFFFDWIAILKFLFSASFTDAFAILRAHAAYLALLGDCLKKRAALQKTSSPPALTGLYNRSIVFDYYLNKKMAFSDLNHRDFEKARDKI